MRFLHPCNRRSWFSNSKYLPSFCFLIEKKIINFLKPIQESDFETKILRARFLPKICRFSRLYFLIVSIFSLKLQTRFKTRFLFRGFALNLEITGTRKTSKWFPPHPEKQLRLKFSELRVNFLNHFFFFFNPSNFENKFLMGSGSPKFWKKVQF